jgi:NTE family protein
VQTLEKYIDYDKLKPNGNANARLILTAVNILTAEPLTFDSFKQQISSKHILATSAYPLYNFRWIEVEEGVFAWDGGLLSNTPLREVIDASPVNDKRAFLVENYPKSVDALPKNLPEVYHRARDIIFSDKTEHNVTMSQVITRYLEYIEELYQLLEKSEQEDVRRVSGRYIPKSDPFIVMVSTPYAPDGLFDSIEKEPEDTCIYKRLFLDYTYGLDKIYTKRK